MNMTFVLVQACLILVYVHSVVVFILKHLAASPSESVHLLCCILGSQVKPMASCLKTWITSHASFLGTCFVTLQTVLASTLGKPIGNAQPEYDQT